MNGVDNNLYDIDGTQTSDISKIDIKDLYGMPEETFNAMLGELEESGEYNEEDLTVLYGQWEEANSPNKGEVIGDIFNTLKINEGTDSDEVESTSTNLENYIRVDNKGNIIKNQNTQPAPTTSGYETHEPVVFKKGDITYTLQDPRIFYEQGRKPYSPEGGGTWLAEDRTKGITETLESNNPIVEELNELLTYDIIPEEYKAISPNFKTKYEEENAPPVLVTEDNKEKINIANNYVNNKPYYTSISNVQTNIFNKEKNNAILNQNATKNNYLPLWEFQGHERDLMHKLRALHGDDFEFSSNISLFDSDNEIIITRKSDKESITIKLEDLEGYTEEGEASQTKGYSEYINFVYGANADGLKLATEQYTELALGYKDPKETWSQFYTRTQPEPGELPEIPGDQGRQALKYEQINIMVGVSVRQFTDGRFEYGGNDAIQVDGTLKKVTEEHKKMFHQLALINRVHHKRQSISANVSSNKYKEMAINDPVRLINQMYNREQRGPSIRDKNGNIVELTKNDENFTTFQYEIYKNEELLKNFSEFYLNDSGAVEFQVEYSDALQAEYKKIPNYEEEVEKIKNKHKLDEQAEKISGPLIKEAKAKAQEDYNRLLKEQSDILNEEIRDGEHRGLNTEQLNDLINKRVDALMNYKKRDSDLENAIYKQMEEFMDPFNKELSTTLDSLLPKEFKEEWAAKASKIEEATFDKFLNLYKGPGLDVLTPDKLEEISQFMDEHGGATGGLGELDWENRKLLINTQWKNLEAEFNEMVENELMTKEEVEKAKREYYSHFYKKYNTNKNDTNSQFYIKDTAQGAINYLEKELEKLSKNYKTKYSYGPGGTRGYEFTEKDMVVQTAISPMDQAKMDNPAIVSALRDAKDILDNPEKASQYGTVNLLKGIWDAATIEKLPFLGDFIALGNDMPIYKIKQKVEAGEELSYNEELALSMSLMLDESNAQVRELSEAYNWGETIVGSVSFMAEMYGTLGIYNATKLGIKRGLSKKFLKTGKGKMLTRVSKNGDYLFMQKGISNRIKAKTLDGFSSLVGVLAAHTATPDNYIKGTFDNMAPELAYAMTTEADELMNQITKFSFKVTEPGQDPWTAAKRGYFTSAAEFFTERLGVLFGPMFSLPGKGLNTVFNKLGLGDDMIKRFAISTYMRKMGLDKLAFGTKVMKEKLMWNGVIGEVGEEIVNFPLQNLINAKPIGEGLIMYDQDPNSPNYGKPLLNKNGNYAMDRQSMRDMFFPILIQSAFMSTAVAGYNKMRGVANPQYLIDYRAYEDKKTWLAEIRKMKKNGTLTNETVIDVRNDGIAFDQAEALLGKTFLENNPDFVKTGTGENTHKDQITATEIEILSKLTAEERAELSEAEQLRIELYEQRAEVEVGEMSKRDKKRKLREIDNNINQVNNQIKGITKDAIEVIGKQKVTTKYNKLTTNVKKIVEKISKLIPGKLNVIEGLNLEDLKQKILEFDFGFEFKNGKYYDKKTGKVVKEITIDKKKYSVEEALEVLAVPENLGYMTAVDVDGTQTIILNKEAATKVEVDENNNIVIGAGPTVAQHEFLHFFLKKTIDNNPGSKIALGEALYAYLGNIDPRQIANKQFRNRLVKYQKEFGTATMFEETLNVFSDAISNGHMEYRETVFTKIGDILRRLFSAGGTKVTFTDGRSVYNFIRDYNRSIEKGKLSKGFEKTLIEGAEIEGEIESGLIGGLLEELAESEEFQESQRKKSIELSEDVQDIYKKDGVDGAFEIADKYRGMAEDVYNRYKNNLPQDLQNILQADNNAGKKIIIDGMLYLSAKHRDNPKTNKNRSVVGMVQDFKSEKQKYDNIAAYINKFFSRRAIEEFKEFLPKAAAFVDPSDTTTQETETEGPGIVVAERLEITEEVVDAVRSMKFYDVKKVGNKYTITRKPFTKKELENKGYSETPNITTDALAKLLNISVKKILDPSANITPDELARIQFLINKHINLVVEGLPEGTTVDKKKTTGARPSLLRLKNAKGESILYEKGRRIGNLTPYIKKKNISIPDLLEAIGIPQEGRPIRITKGKAQQLAGSILYELDRIISNQTVRQVFGDTNLNMLKDGRGRRMYSIEGAIQKTYAVGRMDSKLSDRKKAILWSRIMEFSQGDMLDRSVDSIKLQLQETYGDVFTKEEIDDLAKRFENVISKLKPAVIKKPVKLSEALLLINENQFKKVASYFGTGQASKAFRDTDRQSKYRAHIALLASEIMDWSSPESISKSIEKIRLLKGHTASSSRNSHIERKHIFPDLDKMLEGTLGKLVGPNGEVLTWKTEKTKGKDPKTVLKSVTVVLKNSEGKVISTIPIKLTSAASSQTSAGAINSSKNTEKKTKRKQNEKIARELLNDIISFYSKLYKKGEIDNTDLMMVSASLLSGMESVLARAASLKYIATNAYRFKNPGKTLKYEHMLPRVAVLLNMWDVYINKGGIENFDGGVIYKSKVNKYLKETNTNTGKKHTKKEAETKALKDVLDSFLENYTVQIIPNTMDTAITDAGLGETLLPGQTLQDPSWMRTYNMETILSGKMVPMRDIDTGEILVPSEAAVKTKEIIKVKTNQNKGGLIQSKATIKARNNSYSLETKGITVLDFDDTLATSKSRVIVIAPNGKKSYLNAAQYAAGFTKLQEQGYTFDFSEFSKVIKGKIAPLFQKALKLQGKFGPENMFILTARPTDSGPAIYKFLKANGLNIPLKNIAALGNSTAEAKANWIAEKVSEGYNDFYFADDAMQNVEAVKNVLDQYDVKSKVQQAKRKFSKDIDIKFNKLLDETFGVGRFKKFSPATARQRGKSKGRFSIFLPPSAEDMKGLIYGLLAKGKKGEKQLEFLTKTILQPFSRGIQELDLMRQTVSDDYKALKKSLPKAKKKLKKTVEGTDYTWEQAVRIYLWNNAGFEIPGLTKTMINKLSKAVENDIEIKTFADSLSILSKQEKGYSEPSDYWITETIASDLESIVNSVTREQVLSEFIENRKAMFGEWQNGKLVGPNINKIEAIKGLAYREALEDMLWRMEFGGSRNFGSNRLTNRFANWVNNSIGAIMFFNMRSALLQLLSTVNYINWNDNNPAKAAMAFANQKQYWTDFVYIWNSPMMKQRRGGLRGNIETAEIAQAAKEGGVKGVFALLLKLGFKPTQIADSFAIASGGASMYRNRVKEYVKKGFNVKEAEEKAWQDFAELTQEAQQSSREDKISMQQAGPLGRLILAFQNTPMQYTRLMKRSMQDLINRRGDTKTNISKILYYGAIQNFIFSALQNALFKFMFVDDDEEDEDTRQDKKKRQIRIGNSMMDTILRGSGVGGAIISTLKNMVLEFATQEKKGNFDESAVLLDFLNLSPPIGSKARKIVSAQKTWKYQGDEIKYMSKFNINNPIWSVIGNVTSGLTNIPLDRLVNKTINLKESFNSDHEAWQRIAMFSGWNTWDLDVEPEDLQDAREKIDIIKELEKEEKKKLKLIEKEKEKYKGMTEQEIISAKRNDELFKLKKDEQVNMLLSMGLSSKEIKELKYEADRVNKIMELESKDKNQ